MKLAVIGANGQVGAELCLLLQHESDIEVVPVCRSRMGSAYLRYRGLACRHGDVSDANAAPHLLGDCDVVVNLALPNLANDLRKAQRVHGQLIANSIRYSSPEATIIYASTMSVYGDRRVDDKIVFNSLYGREKLRGEKVAENTARKCGRRLFVFRLGHVMGDLQNITKKIREMVRCGEVVLPDPERWSNTVHIVTIADAIKRASSQTTLPGIYDIFNVPQWTWQEVIEWVGEQIGISVKVKVAVRPAKRVSARFRSLLRGRFGAILRAESTRRFGARWAGLVGPQIMRRLKAARAVANVRADVAKFSSVDAAWDALERRPIEGRSLQGLQPTRLLLHRRSGEIEKLVQGAAKWPHDVPLAGETDV